MTLLNSVIPNSNVLSFSTTKQHSLSSLLKRNALHNVTTISMEQPHGSNFQIISDINQTSIINNVDAIITNQKQHLLVVRSADCLPILFYHPSGFVGAIHAGRKSTLSNLTFKVFNYLFCHYNLCDSFSIWFGPAICNSCYEIDYSTKETFHLIRENLNQLESIFNLKTIDLYLSNLCTCCQNDLFFSYRNENQTKKRNYSAIISI
ncbi:hypothetical protein DID75_00560 [Candidatus Marinamargulisbacteria bacterium SCGC AG-410-N11]|nr:hypothetical protein DID75_00560 [Candidatus Marinamargulisbacteria bacterium SCGC AG-410-N11]